MTDRTGIRLSVQHYDGYKETTDKIGMMIGGSSVAIVNTSAAEFYVLNRGRNTGAGPEYVYWLSPNALDPTGNNYPSPPPGDVPFAQLTDIIWVQTVMKLS
jgi:hypothetical protein